MHSLIFQLYSVGKKYYFQLQRSLQQPLGCYSLSNECLKGKCLNLNVKSLQVNLPFKLPPDFDSLIQIPL